MDDLISENKGLKQELAVRRLERIDTLFAAFGPFISALFVSHSTSLRACTASMLSL